MTGFLAGAAILATCLMLPGQLRAQDKAKGEKSKIHLSITQDVDGKHISIDTTYTADQQEAMTEYLESLGIHIQPLRAPLPPPPPPSLPGGRNITPPAPPAPPLPPPPPSDEHSFRYFNGEGLSEEQRKKIDEEIARAMEEIKNIELPEMPDLKGMFDGDMNIHIDGKELNMEERGQFEKEMENLKIEMEQLKERMKDLKIEIREREKEPKKEEGSLKYNDGHSFSLSGQPYYCYFSGDGKMTSCYQSVINTGTSDNSKNSQAYAYRYRTEKTTEGTEDADHSSESRRSDTHDGSYSLTPSIFKAYPNPGDGRINLIFSLGKKEPVTIRIVDTAGKTVYGETDVNFDGSYNKTIDISREGRGVYLLSVTQGSSWLHEKLVVK